MKSNLVTLLPQFFDVAGNPLSGGMFYSYVAGTSTALSTYPTQVDAIAKTNPNPNPVIINSSGYPSNSGSIIGLFLSPASQYKFVLKDSSGAVIYTLDNISTLDDAVYDGNGNAILVYSPVNYAVNQVTLSNAATGNSPTISATGSDTNVGLQIKQKGTGTLALQSTGATSITSGTTTNLTSTGQTQVTASQLSLTSTTTTTLASTGATTVTGSSISLQATGQAILQGTPQLNDVNGNELLKTNSVTSAVNEVTVSNAITATSPSIKATGDDTNVDLTLSAKGTGTLAIQKPGTSFSTKIDNSLITANRTLVLPDQGVDLRGSRLLQSVDSISGALQFGSTVIPNDNTPPQITEGDQYFSLSITPYYATSKLIVRVSLWLSHQNNRNCIVALFRDSNTNAIGCASCFMSTANGDMTVSFVYTTTSGSTSPTTFTVRAGSDGTGVMTINGQNLTALLAGTGRSGIDIQEVY